AALAAILQHSSCVVLIEQPPELPEYASRQSFRELGLRPVFEEPNIRSRRLRTNTFLKSLESERVRVVHVDSLFHGPDGSITFCDDAGRQLFHNKTHISGWGGTLAKPAVVAAIRDVLYNSLRPTTAGPDTPIAGAESAEHASRQ